MPNMFRVFVYMLLGAGFVFFACNTDVEWMKWGLILLATSDFTMGVLSLIDLYKEKRQRV